MSQKKREINPLDAPVFFNASLKKPSLFDNNQRPEKKQRTLQPLVINEEKPITNQSINAFLQAHNVTELLRRVSPWFAMLPQFKVLLDHIVSTKKSTLRSTDPRVFFNDADIAVIKKEILTTKLQILQEGDQVLASHFTFSCMKLIKHHLASEKIYPGLFSFLVKEITAGTLNKYKSLDKDYILEVFQGPEEVIALLGDIKEYSSVPRRTRALNNLKPYIPAIIAKVELWYKPDNLLVCQTPSLDETPIKTREAIPASMPGFVFFPAPPIQKNLSPRTQNTAAALETDSALTDSEKEWLALLNI